jgi:hypothetical protein
MSASLIVTRDLLNTDAIVTPLCTVVAHSVRSLPVRPCIPDDPRRKRGSRSGRSLARIDDINDAWGHAARQGRRRPQ